VTEQVEQVEQSDPLALLGERAGDAPVQFGVPQQAVQVDDERAGVRATGDRGGECEVALSCDGTTARSQSRDLSQLMDRPESMNTASVLWPAIIPGAAALLSG
jgi:2-polyprenyl-6-methoxyphenol hydroxylase-like FAD-dependent oxidoreductase